MLEFEYVSEKREICRGKIEVIKSADPVEANITINGINVFIIVGSYISGHFICIPEWSVGSALARLDDYRWNYERLTQCPKITSDTAKALTAALEAMNPI